jgi:hypothetical protein
MIALDCFIVTRYTAGQTFCIVVILGNCARGLKLYRFLSKHKILKINLQKKASKMTSFSLKSLENDYKVDISEGKVTVGRGPFLKASF